MGPFRPAALLIALSSSFTAQGFVPASIFTPQQTLCSHPPQMASSSLSMVTMTVVPPITVSGNNIELTEPLQAYVRKRLENTLGKLGGDVTSADVHLMVNKNPRVSNGQEAEVVVFAKGTVIRAKEGSETMYASIDLVTDRIKRKLRQYKERKTDARRHRTGLSENISAAAAEAEEVVKAPKSALDVELEADEEEFVDTYGDADLSKGVDMSVVKTKEFPMPPQTVEDAVTCLEYIDHPFYVFRNSETMEVNVVYKRNHGGIGLIQPDSQAPKK